MRFLAAAVLSSLLVVACKTGERPEATSKSSAPVASAPAVPEAPKEPPTPSEPATFEAADKVPLSGTVYVARDPGAPVLVLVHRFRGDRQEWAPFAERMAKAEHRYTIVSFDLRGHGESRSSSGKKKIDWADMKDKDMPALVEDVHAALDYGFQRAGKASRAVIVGSSLGAALAARAASQDARVVALGLVSPGAAIQGYDVYHPFADVRMLPSFLAGAKEDNVCKEPLDALSRMGKEHATLKSYDGKGHGVFGMAQEGDALFKDLEEWLMGVFASEPVAREVVPREGEKKKEHKG